jgi:hypothetical protein
MGTSCSSLGFGGRLGHNAILLVRHGPTLLFDFFRIFLEILIEHLDLGGLAELIHGFLHLLAQQNIADRRLHLVKRLRRARFAVFDLDHVPAEIGLHWL